MKSCIFKTRLCSLQRKPRKLRFCTTQTDQLVMGTSRMVEDRQIFDLIGKKIGVKTFEDWYKVKSTDVQLLGGSTLLKPYNNSLQKALQTVYTNYNWFPWLFERISPSFFSDKKNQRQYLDWLGKQLGINSMEDWYRVTQYKLKQYDSSYTLLSHYNSSLGEALQNVYPEFNWQPWKFTTAPKRMWDDPSIQRKFLESAFTELQLNSMEDWYKVSPHQLIRVGGNGILTRYGGSMYNMLKTVYPDYKWSGWKFQKIPDNYWNDQEHVASFVQHLAKEFHISTLDDWYRVSMEQMNSHRAQVLLKKYKGLYNILKEVYPQHNWNERRFDERKKAAQRWLVVMIQQLFPNHELHEDFIHPEMKFPESQRNVELDVYIPSLSLAFEYQGKHHYSEVPHFGPMIQYQKRDDLKKKLCSEYKAGEKSQPITLIEIPFWWDNKLHSLLATVLKHRPDLKDVVSYANTNAIPSMMEAAQPIPEEPPVASKAE